MNSSVALSSAPLSPSLTASPTASSPTIMSALDSALDSALLVAELPALVPPKRPSSTGSGIFRKHKPAAPVLSWSPKLYVLVRGTLLRFSTDKRHQRVPESVFVFTAASIVRVTDAIPGSQWVLQVSPTAARSAAVASYFADSPTELPADCWYLVMPDPGRMTVWMRTMRDQIAAAKRDQIAAARSEASSPTPALDANARPVSTACLFGTDAGKDAFCPAAASKPYFKDALSSLTTSLLSRDSITEEPSRPQTPHSSQEPSPRESCSSDSFAPATLATRRDQCSKLANLHILPPLKPPPTSPLPPLPASPAYVSRRRRRIVNASESDQTSSEDQD
ncbi:hypothetical protein NEOLI_002534 [Neolecta irregularis DAH-3]|uniref:PH domain-containing protein n=1 Tax=Neolecta irregularis (strain DAH-3) TaxID=1198029 RepID=A0A1U7LRN2_NEOID|nr:hypothetical protein NEOLI_002534 [Neolecta irregularis DAH-3]|eukprot:OLL25325.1 hypothetical protein NEOLI_002534 [Neolecta irregularis DAH-3]